MKIKPYIYSALVLLGALLVLIVTKAHPIGLTVYFSVVGFCLVIVGKQVPGFWE
jgi:hypothetical protein